MQIAREKKDWKKAKQFFNSYPKQVKMNRKLGDTSVSFLKVDETIYALDKGYLGEGAFGKVKRIFDKKGNAYVVKIEGGRLEGNNELTILNFLGWGRGSVTRMLANSKDFLGYEISRKIYTISKLQEGTELFEVLTRVDNGMRKKNELTPTEYLVIALMCCLCVAELHEQRVIHADLKSENLILESLPYDCIVHAIDFSFSKILPFDQENIIGARQGTPEFAAPEITDNGLFSKCSDIYALGKMFQNDFSLPYEIWYPMIHGDAKQRPTLEAVMQLLAHCLETGDDPDNLLVQNALTSLREFHGRRAKILPILQMRPQLIYDFYRNRSAPSLLSWIYPNHVFKKRISMHDKGYFLDLLQNFCDSLQPDEQLNYFDKAVLFSGIFQKILQDENNKSKTLKNMCRDYIRKIEIIYPQATQRAQHALFKDKLDQIIYRISRSTMHRQTF